MDDGEDETEVDPWHARRQGHIASQSIRDAFKHRATPHLRGQPPASARNDSRRPETGARGANLNGADLRFTDLSVVHLEGAQLSSVTLLGAHLEGADLTGANLTRAKGLPQRSR